MAPVACADHNVLEQQLKDTIQSLHNVMVQVSAYDTATASSSTSPISTPVTSIYGGPNSNPNNPNSTSNLTTGAGAARPSRDVIATELTALQRSLATVHRTASTPTPDEALPHIPPELIQYVDNGRNPDIYTREFVELVRRNNQLMRGKQDAFASFRDVLAGEMERAMPELREDAAHVVVATGGRQR
ncbi:Uu.00g060990.m01.CDS01 [Anthostomella pinea]|uniref:Mediator of RNA polymerase II transcription subunit 10 n=1 Tax=Anthostomella pinea TaxID=933095 RepID=A0AAI8VT70_9PEZI|nr:Uu.00g060990.m01.CDS01 [Anthostomella pinea]